MRTFILTFALAASALSAAAGSVHELFAKGPDEVTLAFVKTNAGPVDLKDDMRCTTLHYAARYGRIETAKWLVALKADINTVSYNKFTPMHMVSDAALAQFLIQSGADLEKKNAWGKTPLQMAAQERRTNVCDVILASGFPIDLSSALRLGKRDLVKKMIQADPKSVTLVEEDSDLFGNTSPLGVAAAQGDKEMVVFLLKAGAPVNAATRMPDGEANALCNAVWAGHYDIAEILCKAGANCNMVGFPTILDFALKHSDQKMVDLLVKHGAKASDKR